MVALRQAHTTAVMRSRRTRGLLGPAIARCAERERISELDVGEQSRSHSDLGSRCEGEGIDQNFEADPRADQHFRT